MFISIYLRTHLVALLVRVSPVDAERGGGLPWTSRYNHDHNDHNDHDDHNDHNDHDDHLDVDEPALVAADVLPAGAPLRGPRGQPHVLAGLHLWQHNMVTTLPPSVH